jgi:quinol monooxygenase YgiN
MSTLMLINKMTAKPGTRDDVTAILLESGHAFDELDECLMYAVTHDADDPDVIWVQDVWADAAAHEAAMAEPRMREQVQRAIPLLAGMPEQHRVTAVGGKSPFVLPGA